MSSGGPGGWDEGKEGGGADINISPPLLPWGSTEGDVDPEEDAGVQTATSAQWEETSFYPVTGIEVFPHSPTIVKLISYDALAQLRLRHELDTLLLLGVAKREPSRFVPRLSADIGEVRLFLGDATAERNPIRSLEYDFKGYGTLEDFFGGGEGLGRNSSLLIRVAIIADIVNAVRFTRSKVRPVLAFLEPQRAFDLLT